MQKITLEEGDYLEQKYSSIIREKLPSYEILWSMYIGHDGLGNMPDLTGQLPDEELTKRQNVGEHLYTCLESLICVYEISDVPIEVNLKDRKTYTTMLNSFIAFQAHCGRIRDNFDKIAAAVNNKKMILNLDNLYEQRNNILHGRKIPMRIENSLIVIPKIQGKEVGQNAWSDKLSWNEEGLTQLFLDDYIKETTTMLFAECNSIIAGLITPIKDIVSQYGIKIPKPSYLTDSTPPSGVCHIETPPSASTITYKFTTA